MALALWAGWAEVWQLYHKVTFDGENRRIIINPGVSELSVKTDIYSAWKEWSQAIDNSKFLAAIRTTGGDPIGGSLFAGDIYFLINGWQIIVTEFTAITGILFHDDPISPYIIEAGAGLIATVSNLVQTVGSQAADVDTQAIATAVVQELDSNSTSINEIQITLQEIETALTRFENNTDLEPVLVDLQLIKKKIDETQAFVLSS